MRGFKIVKGYESYFNDLELPKRQTENAAGYDFSSIKDYDIKPNEIVMIETGIKAYMEKDEVLQIYPRSSLAIKKGLTLSNNTGIIDSDYFENPNNDGHIMLQVINIKDEVVHVRKGERLAQGIFVKYLTTEDDVPGGKRNGGFGSTSK